MTPAVDLAEHRRALEDKAIEDRHAELALRQARLVMVLSKLPDEVLRQIEALVFGVGVAR